MKSQVCRSFYYLDYILRSRHRKGRGIHSPFVYEFVSNVLFDTAKHPEYVLANQIREELITSGISLPGGTFGAGSVHPEKGSRKIRDMVRYSSVQPKFGELLFRIAKYYKPLVVAELGTSIGVSTFYLAKGAPKAEIISIDGNIAVCDYARSLFKKHHINNVSVVNEQFDDYLPYFNNHYPAPGVVFIDGNHTYESTLKYFHHFSKLVPEGFLLFDDINWSPGMHRAWKEIKADPSSQVTIDLFFIGIVIRQKSITPGHYTIRF